MRQLIYCSIFFLYVQLGLFAQSHDRGAVEMSIPFSVAGFQVCESYSVVKQKQVLKDFQVHEIDSEFGGDSSFYIDEDEKNFHTFTSAEKYSKNIQSDRNALL